MRGSLLGILLFGLVFQLGTGRAEGQSMLEGAAAATGGAVGGVAGKKVSDGLNKILGKIDTQTAKAADTTKNSKKPDPSSPLLEVGPGVPKSDGSNVPPPPAVHRASVRRPVPPPELPVPVILPPPPPPAPPPPEATSAELKQVTPGTSREDVLKLGAPAARIMMFDEGHLLEIYRYQSRDSVLGVVRLTDGAVSTVQVH